MVYQDDMQELYLVIGGELKSLASAEFRDPKAVHVVGVFPDHDDAKKAWKANAQKTVDNALMRYFVVPLRDAMSQRLHIALRDEYRASRASA